MISTSVDDLRTLLVDFVAEYPARSGQPAIWRSPLLATARADRRFEILTRVADAEHLMPWELLDSAQSVVVFFVPFTQELAQENTPGKFPSRSWGQAYISTNELIGRASQAINDYLTGQGHQVSLTPATHNFDPIRLVSRWSHKHLAHLSGLGRFGHNAQMITPAGCCGRLGSLVTDADLGDHPLVQQEELCLHRLGQQCLKCAQLCPVAALTEDGLDRPQCYERLQFNWAHLKYFQDLSDTTHVCAKCQVGMPCSFGIPQPDEARV
jgi:epoxyqueuosine reductase QueG